MSDSPLPFVSASQISEWVDCQRKWAFKYVDRVEVTKTPAAEAAAKLGTEVQDEQLDPYLRDGREFDFSRPSGEIALALKALLPAGGSAEMWRPRAEGEPSPAKLQLRRKFVIPSPTGLFAYQGEFDLWAPDSSCVPGLAAPGAATGRVLLGDIKTSKNFDYAKTEEKLKTDIQCVIYKTVVLIQDGVNELDVVWFYTKTKGAHRAQRYHLMVGGNRSGENYESTSHVVEQFQKIDATARQLVSTKAQTKRALDLAPTGATNRVDGRSMCDSYGGCPYSYRCNLSPSVHAEAVNREAVIMNSPATVDFLAGLRKGAPAAPPPAPVAPVAVVVPSVSALPPAVAYAPPAAPNPFTVPAPTALPDWVTAPVDPMVQRQAAPPVVMPATVPAINPPEAALPPAPPVGVVVAAEAPKRRGRPPKASTPATTEPGAVLGAGPASIMLEEMPELVALMRSHGVKKLDLYEGKVHAIELFGAVS